MRCTKCGTDNAADARFCNQCATPLNRPCPKCAHLNAPDAKFCSRCAAALGGQAAVGSDASDSPASRGGVRIAPEQPDASTTLDGERKTVTALFADIRGSTELMEDLDPEEARAIIDPVLRLMIEAVHHYDGYSAPRRRERRPDGHLRQPCCARMREGPWSSRQGRESRKVKVLYPSIACIRTDSISGACGGNEARSARK